MALGRELDEIPGARETVFRGAVIDVEHMTVTLPNGREALREIVRHKGAAAVVPVDAQGVVTLVRQYRAPIARETLEIPAGKLDSPDEPPIECARRELREETGLCAGRMTPMLGLITTPGFCDERIWMYLATDLTQHAACPDADEFLNVVRMPLAEAVRRVLAGELCDGKTALGLLMARALLERDSDA